MYYSTPTSRADALSNTIHNIAVLLSSEVEWEIKQGKNLKNYFISSL